MAVNHGAIEPIVPFPTPINIPDVPPDYEGDQVYIRISYSWVPVLLGAALALRAQSTWNTDDAALLNIARDYADEVLYLIAQAVPLSELIQFRLNPDNPAYWDYSTDAGATWTRQPDTVSSFTPEFEPNISYPSGYQLTVNNGVTTGPVPVMNNVVNDAIRSFNPSDLLNIITAATGVTPLQLDAGGVAALITQGSGIGATIDKAIGADPGTTDGVIQVLKTAADLWPILVTVLA